MFTRQMLCTLPRSIVIQLGSAACALSQRVPTLPSTARFAPVSAVDAVAVLPCATLVVPHCEAIGVGEAAEVLVRVAVGPVVLDGPGVGDGPATQALPRPAKM